jgi:hypothetical protein
MPKRLVPLNENLSVNDLPKKPTSRAYQESVTFIRAEITPFGEILPDQRRVRNILITMVDAVEDCTSKNDLLEKIKKDGNASKKTLSTYQFECLHYQVYTQCMKLKGFGATRQDLYEMVEDALELAQKDVRDDMRRSRISMGLRE